MAIAQADVRAYGAEVRKLASEMRGAGDEAKAGLQGQLLQAAEHFERAGAAAAGFRSQLAPVREAAHEGGSALGLLKENAAELAAAFGVGFGAEKILESIKALAEMGEQTVNMASALGTTPEKYGELAGAMELIGANAETAGRTIAILSRNINLALENPSGTQGRAFQALKISADELREGLRDPITFAETTLAERGKRFITDSPEPGAGGAEFKNILGRGGLEFQKALTEGPERVAELIKKWHELTGLNDKILVDLAGTGEKIHELGKAFEGVEVAIYESFKQPIDDSITSTETLLTKTKEIVDYIKGAAHILDQNRLGPLFMPGAPSAGPPVAPPEGFEEGGEETEAGRRYRAGKGLLGAWGLGGESGGTEEVLRAHGGESPRLGGGPREEMLGWLTAHGYSPDASAAIAGNASVESSFRTDARNESGHFGLFQWDKERQRALGGSTDLPKQMELMDAELLKLDPAFKTASGSVEELTKRFEQKFERSGGQLEGKRESAAREIAGKSPDNIAHAPNYPKIVKDYENQVKEIDATRKTLLDSYDQEIKGARDDQDKIRVIETQKDQVEKDAIAQRVKAREEALAKSEPGSLGYEENRGKIEGVGAADKDRDEQIRIATGAQERERRAEEEAASSAVKASESKRRISDQEVATELQGVEGRRRVGDITAADAAAEEERIVANHLAATERIFADELAASEKIKKIHDEVANHQKEAEAKAKEEIRRIRDKADQEEEQRAHSIDKEIAGAASGAIVNAAWGKGGGIGQQISGFVQSQEKKALDAVGTKLLDASGVGKLFEGIGDTLFSFLPGAGKTAGETALGASSTTAAGQVAALGTAASVAASQMSVGGTAGAVKGGAGILGDLPIIGGLFGGGGAVAGIGGAATLSSGTSALDALAPALLALEGGGVIPSAAGGMTVNDGMGGTIAIVHPNEMVLPAPLSLGIQNAISRGNGWSIPAAPALNTVEPSMAGSGDTYITNNHSWDIDGVLSTHDLQRTLMKHSDTIALAVARASRDFNPAAR